MKSLVTTTACLLALLAGSTAWGQPAQVSTLALSVDTLNASGGMVMGPDGLLYVSNAFRDVFNFDPTMATFGSEIYKVNPADGSVELFADGLNGPFGMAFDHNGNLLVTNVQFGTVSEISPEAGVSGFGTPGGVPAGIAMAADSSIFVAKCQPQRDRGIIRFAPNSSIFAEIVPMFALSCPLGLTFDDEGNFYVSFTVTSPVVGPIIRKYGPDGSDLGLVAFFEDIISFLNHIVYSPAANVLYVTATLDHRVWKVTLDGAVSVLAGSGFPGTADGAGTSASFTRPNGLVVSVTGDTIYVNQTISETSANPNSIRMITGVLNADTSPVANEDEAEVPAGFILAQNYPNPFNPATRIGFELPQAQHVTLTVYDLLGRAVVTLVDGFKPAGSHEAVFDARALTSGVYVYRLEAEHFSRVKMMTLLK